jgi:tetratricopeptide (TPR) repeat protein
MKKIVLLFCAVCSLWAADISGSFNNNVNSVIKITQSVLGEDAQEEIVKALSIEIVTHYQKIDKKLDRLLKQGDFVAYLQDQITTYKKKQTSLSAVLEESQKKIETLEAELEKAKKESGGDQTFEQILAEAEKALANFEFEHYHRLLDSYSEEKQTQAILKNVAKTKYLKAKEYLNRLLYPQALGSIEQAVALGSKESDYLHLHGFILDEQGDYPKALEQYNKALAIFIDKFGAMHPYSKIVQQHIESLKGKK